jgi:hypothetical protein
MYYNKESIITYIIHDQKNKEEQINPCPPSSISNLDKRLHSSPLWSSVQTLMKFMFVDGSTGNTSKEPMGCVHN